MYSGIGIIAMSGKHGSDVLARNQYGYYSRSFAAPGNPDTTYQQDSRANFADVTAGWGLLSSVEQTEWNAAAETGQWDFRDRLGNTCRPTGQQLFVKLNLPVWLHSVQFSRPPAKRPVIVPDSCSLVITEDMSVYTMLLTFNLSSITANTLVSIWTTQLMSLGTTSPRSSRFKLLLQIPAGSFTGSYDFNPDWVARFGAVAGVGRIFCRTEVVDLESGIIHLGPSSWGTT